MKKLLIFSFVCFLSLTSLASDNSVPAICAQGSVLGDDGNCHSCDSLTKFTPKRLVDCSTSCKTKEGKYIRKIADSDDCELVNCPEGFQKDTWGDCKPINDECPEIAPLKDIHGNCYPCSELETIKLKNESDCESKCQMNGAATRISTFWGCELKKCPENTIRSSFGDCTIAPVGCPDTHPLRENASCFDCSHEGAIDMAPDDVHLCQSMCKDEQGNPTRKLYKNAGCGLINCPADKPIKSHGHCLSCDEVLTIRDAKNCDLCQEKRTTIRFARKGKTLDYCALSSCPPEKPLRDILGNCYSCDEEDEVGVKPGACTNICPNRVEKTPEMYHNVLSFDKGAKLCLLPEAEEKSDALIAIKIKNRNTQNKTLLEPKFKQSHCPEDKPLMDYQGGCYDCDDPSNVILELSDLCFKCSNRYFTKRRHFSDVGVSILYDCKISDEDSPKIKRVGNIDYYYNKDNQLEKEEHHLTNHEYADTMIKIYDKKGYSERFEKLGKTIERKNYHNNGKLKSVKTFKDGLTETKYYHYYDSGALKSIIPYQEKRISKSNWQKVKEGVGLWYYETGELKSMIPYKDNKFNGEYKRYTKQGKVREIGVYKDGKVVSKRKIK